MKRFAQIAAAALAAASLTAACGDRKEAAQPAGDTAPATAPAAEPPAEPVVEPVAAPAGDYRLDPFHSRIVFRVDHLGFSWYAATFDRFDAALAFDPDAPETMRVEASINVASLTIPTPPEGFRDELLGPRWLNAAAHPEIRFVSGAVTPTGPRSALVEGTLTLLGESAPVSMTVDYRGGYAGFVPYDPNARIGFTARGRFNRSDFGFVEGLPAEGTTMGVGDAVLFEIEAEFSGPPAEAAQ